MVMSIDKAIDFFKGLRCGTLQAEDARDVAINTMQKYQQLQAEYETHLKADMEAVLKKLYGKLKMIHERYSTAEHWDEAYGVEISMEEVRKKINDLRGKDGD